MKGYPKVLKNIRYSYSFLRVLSPSLQSNGFSFVSKGYFGADNFPSFYSVTNPDDDEHSYSQFLGDPYRTEVFESTFL